MAMAYSLANPLNSYRSQSVMTLSPGELLVKTYDIALSALTARDETRACKVLAHLIDCLDFQHQEISLGLFRLYRYCMEQVRQGQYEVPTRIPRELRDTWAKAIAEPGTGMR